MPTSDVKKRSARPERKTEGAPTRQEVVAMVGPVGESQEAHVQRCNDPRCPRCKWYVKGHVWQGTYGAITPEAGGPRENVIWLSERPAKWGGAWALGCSLCADALARRHDSNSASTSGGLGRGKQRGNAAVVRDGGRAPRWRTTCSWARYEVRTIFMQAEHVRQHACSDIHKLALQAWLRPDAPIRLALQMSPSDDHLLSGSVPQVADWLRSWRWSREGDSWASAERHAQTEFWIERARCGGATRRAIRCMAFVMREVIRAKKREWVKEATCISISFDDRKAHKLVKFNCDVPMRRRGAQPWKSGIVGCLDKVHGDTLGSMDEDYAERTCLKVMEMIETFATPFGETQRDEAVYEQFKRATRSIVVDGALLKSANLLRLRFMPNVILVCRDPAHTVRTAVSEPWLRTHSFETQHKMLFSGKHALIKDVQHSEVLQARLQACQAEVLRERGSQGGGVVSILRHFSFAPHRWESFSAPRRQYCCMLVAIFKCLGAIADDWRMEKTKRERAEECMDAMSGRHVLEVGIAADYSEVCMRFIRAWDKPNRDPATSSKILAQFREEVDALFVRGYILCEPGGSGDIAEPSESLEPPAKTITQIAYEQLQENVIVQVMGREKRMWNDTSKKSVLAVMAEVKVAVAAMLDRLDADFSQNSLYLSFEAFHLDAWKPFWRAAQNFTDDRGYEGLPENTLKTFKRLTRKGKRLFECLGIAWNTESFVSAVTAAITREGLVAPNDNKHIRNRAIWSEALASAQGDNPCSRAAALLWAEPALRFYWSFRDGTSDVERHLGQHTAMKERHPGGCHTAEQVDDSAEVCMELAQEGPQSEKEVAAPPLVTGGPLLLTDFSRECARTWRTCFGARFACQSRRKDSGRRFPGRLEGTLKNVQEQHQRAIRQLLDVAGEDEKDSGSDAKRRRTIFGFRRRSIEKSAVVAPEPGNSLKAFKKRTEEVAAERAQHRVWTGCKDTMQLRRKLKPPTTEQERIKRVRAVVSKAATKFKSAARAARRKPLQGLPKASPGPSSADRASVASAAPRGASASRDTCKHPDAQRVAASNTSSASSKKASFTSGQPAPTRSFPFSTDCSAGSKKPSTTKDRPAAKRPRDPMDRRSKSASAPTLTFREMYDKALSKQRQVLGLPSRDSVFVSV